MVDGSLADAADVIGTPVFTIPKLGFLVAYIQQPPGRYVAISVGAGILLAFVLVDTLLEGKKKEETN